MIRIAIALTCLALGMVGIVLLGEYQAWDATSLDPQPLLILLVGMGQLIRLMGHPTLGRLLLTGALLPLAVALSSYLLPEYWVSLATWEHLAHPLFPSISLDGWRPSLLTVLGLILLAANAWLGRSPSLGSPLLLGTITLLLIMQCVESLPYASANQVLRYAAPLMQQLALWGLLIAQTVAFLPTWHAERSNLHRPLWPALALVSISLLFWHQQKGLEDRSLRADMHEQNRQLAGRFSQEIHDHLAAMRRFANSWSLLDTPPTSAQWTHQAEPYHRDFRYFLNIAFINLDSRIIRVHPMNLNQQVLGERLFDVQPEGREALSQALFHGREGHTGIVELLQGGPGIIHYLPVISADDNRPMGAAAMVVSLPALVGTLFDEIDTKRVFLELRHGETTLASLGPTTGLGPWQYQTSLDVVGHSLKLITRPSRALLLERRARLPVVSLAIGLTLAYLLYLVLYAYRHLALQHRALHRSNAELRNEVQARAKLQQEIEWLARHDELTALPNRRLFMETLKTQTKQRPLSVMICDVDHFKQINDHQGHLIGDRYLKHLGEVGRDVVEEAGGLFARYGGEEFVACLPACNARTAQDIAERLRERIQAENLQHHDGRRLTVSIGLATLENGPWDIATLMQVADEALYRAKASGRDRVVCASNGTSLEAGR